MKCKMVLTYDGYNEAIEKQKSLEMQLTALRSNTENKLKLTQMMLFRIITNKNKEFTVAEAQQLMQEFEGLTK